MEVKVLGCYGGELPGFRSPSFLINKQLVVDAGAIVSTLSIEEQQNLKYILVTHAHLDHIKDIPLLADNIVESHRESLKIISEENIVNAIQKHIMNDYIWPDFQLLPSHNNPTVELVPIKTKTPYSFSEFKVMAVRANHIIDAVAFFVSHGNKWIGFSGDTGPMTEFWEEVNTNENINAIFVETSFPNALERVAKVSGHLTPNLLSQELKKLRRKVKIYIYHLKPLYIETLIKEISELKIPNLEIVEQDAIIKI